MTAWIVALSVFAAGPVLDAPSTAIASGKSFWVDSERDVASLINAKVDVGTLRQVADAIEVDYRWPFSPGEANDLRLTEGLVVPPGSVSRDVERVVCRRERIISFAVDTKLIAPDGKVVRHKVKDASQERKAAEAFAVGYGKDPRSLVCWAAARRCEGKPFHWPPTTLDAAQFTPKCKLPTKP